ncbi:MAG TPA: secretin N-terminal domain-containing protein, partial [Burkholderiaceae bacterium]|nr:secretin N-terminal domain-containing protein [Burkholderiaceae bacterium]
MAVVALSACAAIAPQDQALQLLHAGQVQEAVSLMDEAVRSDPDNARLRAQRVRVRDLAVSHYFMQAQTQRSKGQMDEARATFLRALALEPGNARALEGMEAIEKQARHKTLYQQALTQLPHNEEGARALLQQILREAPQEREARALWRRLDQQRAQREASEPTLTVDLQKTVTFDLRDASLRAAFEFVTQASGLNVFFDKDVKTDQRVAVYAKDTQLDHLVQLILMTQQLERKVVAPNAILVYPATPQKMREHQDLIARTFYLANAEAKQVAKLIQTMVKTKDLYVDEKLNLLVMRDTPEAVRYAEKLIAANDLAEPEVMLQVEVMEITRNRLTELGLRFPDQLALTPAGSQGTTPGVLTLNEAKRLSSDIVQLTVNNPSLVLNLKDQEGLTNLLANPRIRVKNREKAHVLIGERVPVITSTSTSTGFVSESVNYLDVGIRLEVEPNVFLDDEVQIKVGLEVSNIAREIRGATGTLTYQVGTRNASTILRLRDGETQVLAGLINDEDRASAAKLPGLAELPLAGRLFTSSANTRNKTEIVLLITPRILRSIERPDAALTEFYAGTEVAIGSRPLFLRKMTQPAVAGVTQTQSPEEDKAADAKPQVGGVDAVAVAVPPAPALADPPDMAAANATPETASGNQRGSDGEALTVVPIFALQGPDQARVGETIDLSVMLDAKQPVISASLVLHFDPTQWQFVEAQDGQFFKANAAPGAINLLPSAGGPVRITVAGDPARGTAGREQLLKLKLRALQGGVRSRVSVSAGSVIEE